MKIGLIVLLSVTLVYNEKDHRERSFRQCGIEDFAFYLFICCDQSFT
jgi:hypothetical protein